MSNLSAKNSTLVASFSVAVIALLIAITSLLVRDIQGHTGAPLVASVPAADVPTTTIAKVSDAPTTTPIIRDATPVETPTLKTYIEVTDGCAAHFQGECLLVRSGPGKEYPVLSKLRTGIVLRVDDTLITDATGLTWYKVVFDEWLRYPERLHGTWYIAADYVTVLQKPVIPDYIPGVSPTTTKQIIVNRTKQQLYAYDGDTLIMTATTSTGLDSTPTPRGVFTIFKKTPSRYMQGPLPNLDSNQVYDLPGVPWNLYFTDGGAVIHGAYWHNAFGTPYSHGCVNLSLADAHKIYDWAPVGTLVTVRD
jgi:lipoprotein-anchoring transpeptidase ErfK/SrfK